MKNQGESANLFRKTSIFRHIFSKIYHKTVTKARESAGRGKSTATEERKNRREIKTKPPQKQGETAIKARKNTPIDPRPIPQKTAYFTNCLQFPVSPPSDRSRKTPHHPPSSPCPTHQDARVQPVKMPTPFSRALTVLLYQQARALHDTNAQYTAPRAAIPSLTPRAPRAAPRSPPSFLVPPTIPCPPPTPRTLHRLPPRAPLHRPAHRTATPSRPAHAPKNSLRRHALSARVRTFQRRKHAPSAQKPPSDVN